MENQKKFYIAPNMISIEFEGAELLYGAGGSNAEGEECANERFMYEVDENKGFSIW